MTTDVVLAAAIAMVEATPPTLPPGDDTVEWSAIAEDGHTMSGARTFTVR